MLRDEKGKVQQATIIDYKSDDIPDDSTVKELAGRYRRQMELYRGALSNILGLDPVNIAIKLLFVRLGTDFQIQ